MNSHITRLYRRPGFTPAKTKEILTKLKKGYPNIELIQTELCYYVETIGGDKPSRHDLDSLKWVLQDPFAPERLTEGPQLEISSSITQFLVEVGPRFNFSTSNSTNAVSICHSLGLKHVVRLEISRRYLLTVSNKQKIDEEFETKVAELLYDRMTECRYTRANIPIHSFNEKLQRHNETIHDVDVMGDGKDSLKKIDAELGLAFDEVDLDYYTDLFKKVLRRNPTTVECFDLAQSNSEHSRHWFFKGKMIIDGIEQEESLIDMIIKTQESSNPNNVIKFSDNSSAIRGYSHQAVRPLHSGRCSELCVTPVDSHLIFTAETHNFPTGVAPFSGATTGPGGRIRDVQCVGRGGYCIAGTAGYSVGNLLIPDYPLSWEESTANESYPQNFALPLEILIEASNGASDYGNKFGEPLISGFTRTYGDHVPCATLSSAPFSGMNKKSNGMAETKENVFERREWIKPIMFSGGIGFMEASMTEKMKPRIGDQIVKVGGPVYRIGVGGGAASSVEVQGDNKAELDFNAVQRGDAEMENKMNRVVRACLESGQSNPIRSIHDQGAGGNGNVLKELVEPAGGIIYADKFDLGDPTINALELWGAEYQESNAMLCAPGADSERLKKLCARERCPVNFVGEVTGSGRVVLAMDEKQEITPFNLDLDLVLGKMPQKVYNLVRRPTPKHELRLPPGLTIFSALERVLRLPAVSSKRYLTNKVDRCVTGLVAQQQCVGPLHTPLADVAVTALSHFGNEGIASSIGEQPIKGLVDVGAGARMTVTEALSNLVFAGISDLRDVKCSGNWMWAAKLPGEGAALYEACGAMTRVMRELGIAVDGGKDSLSMAARVGKETVKAPGTLVVSAYAPCPDVRKIVTPDLKAPSMNQKGILLHVDLSGGRTRLGGSALAQCYNQLGDRAPDLDQPRVLVNAFNATQVLIKDGSILSGHDISDGGLITSLLEMCFAGMSGMYVNIGHRNGRALEILFSEEPGWILEVLEKDLNHCMIVFKEYDVPVYNVGNSICYGIRSQITINCNNACLESTVLPLMKMWEETSYRLELRQTIQRCAEAEFDSLDKRSGPKYNLTFDPDAISNVQRDQIIPVAVLREEGVNSDREMSAALIRAGFQVWDVTMEDLITADASLEMFRGVVFPGGFSYADVLGSAKGWAAGILFNSKLSDQFRAFYARKNTFSLGICNGCQLMALIGWVGNDDTNKSTGSEKIDDGRGFKPKIMLEHNRSERFECRWSTVRIEQSKAMMLKGMENSILGVWTAHGEGRFTFADDAMTKPSIYTDLVQSGCVALRYTDDSGTPTESYPANPNGSPEGLAGLCSRDGRHLAIMPHPERCEVMWQMPYILPEWNDITLSPWQRMFRNAYDWCVKTNFN